MEISQSDNETNNSSKHSPDFEILMQNWIKLTQNLTSVSKITDFVINAGFPKFFSKNLTKAYENSKKEIDYFFRHFF